MKECDQNGIYIPTKPIKNEKDEYVLQFPVIPVSDELVANCMQAQITEFLNHLLIYNKPIQYEKPTRCKKKNKRRD